ncbi:MAG: adaptor protein MecA [Acetatifactor sp.]|nr:adaptor protein MecA [Acetatifactor sp.]
MKIEKVNENQIRCTLTREDLASRELKISELAYGTEKAKNLFRDMMQQANFEFGFEAEDIPLMIEAIPLNSECIVLIITKVEDPEELDTRFSRFAPSVTEDNEDDEDYDVDSPDEMLDLFRRLKEPRKQAEAAAVPPVAPDPEDKNRTLMFVMDSLQQVMSAAAVTGSRSHGISTLYKDERLGNYFLVLTQGEEKREVFDRICNVISEYGSLKRSHSGSQTYLEEHYEALIVGNALQVLSGR